MTYLTFLTAIALSGIAAYYSVIGLAAIFVGAFWPIVLMGGTLEVAKLVTVSWLYRNWKITNIAMKLYFTVAVVLLMLITSMGIFGFLSKSHLEHSADNAPLYDKVSLIDEKIKVEQEIVNEGRKEINQMDQAVDQTMVRSDSEKGADKSIQVRRSQSKEREKIQTEINTAREKIANLRDERAPLFSQLQKAETDFGPIKYVAQVVYGSGEKDIVDKAVQLVIFIIMLVFDPLAVLLLIASNKGMTKEEKKEEPVAQTEHTKWNQESRTWEKQIVEVPKENLTTMEENNEDVEYEQVITHPAPGIQHVETIVKKKLEPKYDYDEPYAFREKENK